MELRDKQLQRDFDEIVDTMTGADGGVSFMAFKSMVEGLDKQDDADSKALLDFTKKFAKFLRVCKQSVFPGMD